MTKKRARIEYQGSYFWLIFWTILFFPIAFALLFSKSSFELDHTRYTFQYDGSRFWLCFWIIFFFPVSLLLLFLNGYSVTRATVGHAHDQK